MKCPTCGATFAICSNCGKKKFGLLAIVSHRGQPYCWACYHKLKLLSKEPTHVRRSLYQARKLDALLRR